MVLQVQELSGSKLAGSLGGAVHFEDGDLGVDQGVEYFLLHVDLSCRSEGLGTLSVCQDLQRPLEDGDLTGGFGGLLHPEGRVCKNLVMLVGIDLDEGHITGRGVGTMFPLVRHESEVGEMVQVIIVHHLIVLNLEKTTGVVVVLGAVLAAQPHQFVDLSADGATLEGALPEHEEDELVALVIVDVGLAGAAYIPEGGVGSEDDVRVVDCPEVVLGHLLELGEGLQVVGVVEHQGLPLLGLVLERVDSCVLHVGCLRCGTLLGEEVESLDGSQHRTHAFHESGLGSAELSCELLVEHFWNLELRAFYLLCFLGWELFFWVLGNLDFWEVRES